jgi:hypothetical protein
MPVEAFIQTGEPDHDFLSDQTAARPVDADFPP